MICQWVPIKLHNVRCILLEILQGMFVGNGLHFLLLQLIFWVGAKEPAVSVCIKEWDCSYEGSKRRMQCKSELLIQALSKRRPETHYGAGAALAQRHWCSCVVRRDYHGGDLLCVLRLMWVKRDAGWLKHNGTIPMPTKKGKHWSQRKHNILLPKTGVKLAVECTEIAEAYAFAQAHESCESLVCVYIKECAQ